MAHLVIISYFPTPVDENLSGLLSEQLFTVGCKRCDYPAKSARDVKIHKDKHGRFMASVRVSLCCSVSDTHTDTFYFSAEVSTITFFLLLTLHLLTPQLLHWTATVYFETQDLVSHCQTLV